MREHHQTERRDSSGFDVPTHEALSECRPVIEQTLTVAG